MDEIPMPIRPAPKPGLDDTVQVLMNEAMARVFQHRCLEPDAKLSSPVFFGDDETPTYIIEVSTI